MKHFIAIGAASAALTSSAAFAQFANPGFANPATPGIETGMPTADAANASDVIFLRQFAIGNRAEVELGNLADERARASSVQTFAVRMVEDHGDALDELQGVARSKDTPLPGGLDMDHNVVLSQLRETDAEAFDAAYIRAQVVAHQRAVQLLIYQIGNGQSQEIRDFATEKLIGVMEHLEMAKAIHAELTGAAP